ncbi:MAG TPA: SRPBCC family protein, partial [Methylomirabilota bacterium]
MKIRERYVIDRPAATVWPYIVRPEHFAKWNTKIASMDTSDEFRVGQPFTTHYRWNNKSIQC